MDVADICDRQKLNLWAGPSGKTIKRMTKFVLPMDKRKELHKWVEHFKCRTDIALV